MVKDLHHGVSTVRPWNPYGLSPNKTQQGCRRLEKNTTLSFDVTSERATSDKNERGETVYRILHLRIS